MLVSQNRPALVVDDVGTTTVLLTEILRALGFYEVDRAFDGQTALVKLSTKRYGLILSDIHMEPVDGFDLLRRVRSNPQTASLPFIFITGDLSADRVEEARRAGATGYVLKPSSPIETIESIRYALEPTANASFCTPRRVPTIQSPDMLFLGSMRALRRPTENGV
jgi:two-component system chemotaxis response regulator CheY